MRVTIAFGLCLLLSSPTAAMFANVAPPRIEEVPVERLLANLQQNPDRLPPVDLQRALGRIHLLAFLRQSTTLPVYRDPRYAPGIAEGRIAPCPPPNASDAFGDPMPSPGSDPSIRCEYEYPTLAPRPEAPALTRRSTVADAHLRAAIAHYTAAKRLHPEALRTLVALAFAYDAAGQPERARVELRQALRNRWAPLPEVRANDYTMKTVEWEWHVVMGEAINHLKRLATSRADRALVARAEKSLAITVPSMMITPIFVPLDGRGETGDGPERFVDRRSAVRFDFSGQGLPMRAGWLTPGAAWLVWDPTHERQITGGFQLFGTVTWMAFWENGYRALGTLDDDGDGELTGAELDGLALWQDRNGDGVSNADEVLAVTAHGITAVGYAEERVSDEFWVSRRGVTFASGVTRPTYDWVLGSRAASYFLMTRKPDGGGGGVAPAGPACATTTVVAPTVMVPTRAAPVLACTR